jgi:hypothetical protein
MALQVGSSKGVIGLLLNLYNVRYYDSRNRERAMDS